MIREARALAILSLLTLMIVIIAGIVAAVSYFPVAGEFIETLGITLQHLRPIHTSMAIAWIYLGGISIIYHYFGDFENLTIQRNTIKKLFLVHFSIWIVSGIGIIITLLSGFFSGREYIGFHPVFSLLILISWIIFLYIFFKVTSKNIWEKPVYHYMWTISLLLFVHSFIENHLYLFSFINSFPIVEIKLQWKSLGQFVGSFNLLVYGSLLYTGEKISKDTSYAHSKKAFLLFGVGLLNTFTNYAHHTYHLPQSHIVKWISFVVSMLEVIILYFVISDIIGLIRNRKGMNKTICYHFISSCKLWSGLTIFLALLISIPPLNTIIHGTHVVFAHAMGAMIGIDTFAIFGVLSWFIFKDTNLALQTKKKIHFSIITMNLSLFFLIASMSIYGTSFGIYRYLDKYPPEIMGNLLRYSLGVFSFPMSLSFLYVIFIFLHNLVKMKADSN